MIENLLAGCLIFLMPTMTVGLMFLGGRAAMERRRPRPAPAPVRIRSR